MNKEELENFFKVIFGEKKYGDKTIEELPTGIKQFIITQLLSNPTATMMIKKYCQDNNTNITQTKQIKKNNGYKLTDRPAEIIQLESELQKLASEQRMKRLSANKELICNNRLLYESLWERYISTKSTKKYDIETIKNKYNEAVSTYLYRIDLYYNNNTMNKEYNIANNNITQVLKLIDTILLKSGYPITTFPNDRPSITSIHGSVPGSDLPVVSPSLHLTAMSPIDLTKIVYID